MLFTVVTTAALAQGYKLEQRIGFPDFGFMEAPGAYEGPVFVLSDDFPTEVPPLDPPVADILKIDFRTDPMSYVLAVRDYVFAGNIHGGPVSEDFILQKQHGGS